MKKHINKIILILLVLNAIIIYFVLIKTYNKSQTIKLEDNNLVSEIEIDYNIQANPLSKVEIENLSNTNAGINSCVGSLGQSINISGNFFNFQLKDAEVKMKYDESKLNGVKEENIGLLWYDKENDQIVEIDTEIDTETNELKFKTNHFSEYILVDLESWREEWNKRLIREKDENASAFDIAFVIDDSGSMVDNDPQNARLAACEDFVNILRDKDGYSVLAFDYGAMIEQELTTDKSKVTEALEKFESSGGTDIAQGLQKGIEVLNESKNVSKVIVLLTDGEDSTLQNEKEEIITEALNNNITIYSIFLNAGKEEVDVQNTIDIQEIANSTGGTFYYISSDEVVDIFQDISKEAVGIENGKDTDGDGIIDEIEIGGIRNQFGQIIYTNPYDKDTDGDGISDKEEIGELVENENGAVYYKFKSNPLLANSSIQEGYVSTGHNINKYHNKTALGRWDSGFELNKNGFKFLNPSIEYSGGVCAGISYVVEKTFNKEEIDHSIENPDTPTHITTEDLNWTEINKIEDLKTFLEKSDNIYVKTIVNDQEIINELKNNPSIYIFENKEDAKKLFIDTDTTSIDEIYANNQIAYICNHLDGFNVTDQNIIDGNMYFYNPVGILKSYNGGNITYEEKMKDDADGNLLRELYYYYIYVNNYINHSNGYEIDYSQPVTEETISKLKNIFSSKQIIRVGIKGHMINAYALEKISETEYRLYLYDNNYPAWRNTDTYIRLLKAYGKDNEKVYVVGKDNIYCNETSKFVDENGTFQLLLEKDDEVINFEKRD